jgi:D-hydroxyproline dehydrogenase subunit beta
MTRSRPASWCAAGDRHLGRLPAGGTAEVTAGRRAAGGSGDLPAAADVVVIGAGLVGAACAQALASAGLGVCVIDRAGPAAGTTAGGEGNILVSDKLPGPEARLALRSIRLWQELASRAGGRFEFEQKGGLVVAHDEEQLAALRALAADQRGDGVRAEVLDGPALRAAEPQVAPSLAGGVSYPQDCQVQPMLAAAWLLAEAGRLGARLTWGAEVLAGQSGNGRITAVVTTRGRIAAGAVVNAAGPWSGLVAERLGGSLPTRPRRGHILVTEPLPPLIRHKVYESDYVTTVMSDSDQVQCSAVVEGTRAGTVLIGSSREFVGFDRRPSLRILAAMAARAAVLFPGLAGVRVLRSYLGFRPASPDHLPMIGPDAVLGGLYHASGHEGAGIGLAPATAELVAALLAGEPAPVDPAPFAPARFAAAGPGRLGGEGAA